MMCYVNENINKTLSFRTKKEFHSHTNARTSPSFISTLLLHLTTHDDTPCNCDGPSRAFFRDACKARASMRKMLSQSKGKTKALKPKGWTDETKYRNH